MKLKHIYFIIFVLFLIGCEEEEYKVPETNSNLQNDVIKKTIGPNVAGLNLEFAYAMALPESAGKLQTAQVVASIPGAAGTYLEHNAYRTGGNGLDVGTQIGEPSVTTGGKSEVAFTRDTCATTLRYYYKIPEEAKGKSISFTFSAKASNGQSVSYTMGPYDITNMDIKLDLIARDGTTQYLSIADMALYTADEAATMADKIDLVYLHRTIAGVTFNHALVSPTTDPMYRPGVTLPSGLNNSSKLVKTWLLRDFHIARTQFGVYIDEVDMQKIDFANSPDFVLNMRAEAGTWVETADGKYRAYIYVNAVNNTAKTMTISIKRLQMK
jgi:hypothetical protein